MRRSAAKRPSLEPRTESAALRLSLTVIVIRLPPEEERAQPAAHRLAPPERRENRLRGAERCHLHPVEGGIAAGCGLRQPELAEHGVGEIEAVQADVFRRFPGDRDRDRPVAAGAHPMRPGVRQEEAFAGPEAVDGGLRLEMIGVAMVAVLPRK